MKKQVSKFVLLGVILFPLFFLVSLGLVGKAVPIEGKIVHNSGFLSASEEQVKVVFFGYVGCSFICPNSLYTLGEVLDEIHEEYQTTEVGGIFVDVNATTQISRAHEYSQYFSATISGYNVTEEGLNDLRSDFGLNVINTNQPGEEVLHTDHFFIVQKVEHEWKVQKVISNQASKVDLKKSVQQFLVQNNYLQIASR